MRCCLMSLLLHVLSDMLQNPQLPSHIHIWPKPNVKLGPTNSFYPAPPTKTLPQTLGKSVSPIGISVSPRWDCNLSVTYCSYFGLTEICSWSHRVCLTKSLFACCWNRSPEFMQSVSPRWGFALTLAHRSHRLDLVGPTEKSKVHIFEPYRSDRVL